MPDEQEQADERQVGPVTDADPDDVAARTSAAEQLPLAERADAFAALHDDLRTRLESGQAPATGHGSGRAAGAGHAAAGRIWASGRGDGGQRG